MRTIRVINSGPYKITPQSLEIYLNSTLSDLAKENPEGPWSLVSATLQDDYCTAIFQQVVYPQFECPELES